MYHMMCSWLPLDPSITKDVCCPLMDRFSQISEFQVCQFCGEKPGRNCKLNNLFMMFDDGHADVFLRKSWSQQAVKHAKKMMQNGMWYRNCVQYGHLTRIELDSEEPSKTKKVQFHLDLISTALAAQAYQSYVHGHDQGCINCKAMITLICKLSYTASIHGLQSVSEMNDQGGLILINHVDMPANPSHDVHLRMRICFWIWVLGNDFRLA